MRKTKETKDKRETAKKKKIRTASRTKERLKTGGLPLLFQNNHMDEHGRVGGIGPVKLHRQRDSNSVNLVILQHDRPKS